MRVREESIQERWLVYLIVLERIDECFDGCFVSNVRCIPFDDVHVELLRKESYRGSLADAWRTGD